MPPLTQVVRWTFVSRRTGHFTVVQCPNIALVAFIVLSGAARLCRHGIAGGVFHGFAVVSLVVWSIDEIARGVNPFRRGLGLVVLATSCVIFVAG